MTVPETRDFSRLAQAFRRWALLVIAAVALGGLAALLVSGAITPQYRATAQLYLAPAANPSLALQEVVLGQSLARSYVELAKAEVVYRPAMAKVGWKDLKSFRDHAQIAQVRDTSVISVSFVDGDPRLASDAANAIVESFLNQSRNLQSTLQASVIPWEPASIPTEAESPRVALNMLAGAAAGGAVAVMAIAFASYADDRIRTVEEVRSRLGVAALGEIQRADRRLSEKLVLRDAPSSRQAEAFRLVRANILFANIDRRPKTILVTSAVSGEGKSKVSANLALAFAEAGSPTILVEADFRRPSQAGLFKRANPMGLTTLLRHPLTPESLEQMRVAPRLIVIPAGTLPPNPANLLGSERMSLLLQELAGSAEETTVIIDTSPVLVFADAIALAPKVDGCLLVIDSERTRGRAVHRAVSALQRVNAIILGAVLNRVPGGDVYGYDAYETTRSRNTRGRG